MKKLLIIFLFVLFIPFNCFAAEKIKINSIILNGPDSVKKGDTFTVEVSGDYSGFNRTEFGVQGIYLAGVLFDFDEDVLVLSDYSAEGYNSVVVMEDGLAYLLGEVNDSQTNKCADGFFNCGPYTAKLTFYVKDTDETDTTIKIDSLELGVFDVLDTDEFDIEDMEDVTCEKSKSINISIKDGTVSSTPPKSVIGDSLPDLSDSLQKKDNIMAPDETSENKTEGIEAKKEAKFLKSLKVKNYTLNFKEDVTSYKLVLSDSVNKLKIEAEAYDKDTEIKIVGADNLKDASDIVKVKLTLPSGEKKTYTINIKRESISDSESASIIHKLNYVVYGVLGFTVFVVIIVLISRARDKRKLKKLLEE